MAEFELTQDMINHIVLALSTSLECAVDVRTKVIMNGQNMLIASILGADEYYIQLKEIHKNMFGNKKNKKLKRKLIKELTELTKDGGWPSLVFGGVNTRDMKRNELELLCILLGHQALERKPINETV